MFSGGSQDVAGMNFALCQLTSSEPNYIVWDGTIQFLNIEM